MAEQKPLAQGEVQMTVAEVSEACREYLERKGRFPTGKEWPGTPLNVDCHYYWQPYPNVPGATYLKIWYEIRPRD